jgi:hypothetical protein
LYSEEEEVYTRCEENNMMARLPSCLILDSTMSTVLCK